MRKVITKKISSASKGKNYKNRKYFLSAAVSFHEI